MLLIALFHSLFLFLFFQKSFPETVTNNTFQEITDIIRVHRSTSQPAITCSKLATETLEEDEQYFTPCSSVSIFNLEQVNAGWIEMKMFVFRFLMCIRFLLGYIGRIQVKKGFDYLLQRLYGIFLIPMFQGCTWFQAKVDIEVTRASKTAIEAVERNGGTVKCIYHDRLQLRALLKPEKYPILKPRPARPKNKYILWYSDPDNRGFLADPEEVEKRRQENVKLGKVTEKLENIKLDS